MGIVTNTSLGCVNLAPETDNFVPGFDVPEIPVSQIIHIMDQLTIQLPFKCISIYGTTNGKHNIIPAAKARGIKVLLTVWLELNETQNAENIRMGIYAATHYPETVVALSCGSEILLREGAAAVPVVRACADTLRAANVMQPIGFREITSSLFALGSSVSDVFNWVGVNVFTYWDLVWSGSPMPTGCNDPATLQAQNLEAAVNQARAMFVNMPIIVSEWGWPSGGQPKYVYPYCLKAGTTPEQQSKVLVNGFEKLRDLGVPAFLFQSFSNGEWKIPQEGLVGMYWGVCDRTYPNNCHMCNPERFDGCKWPYVGIPKGYPRPPLTISKDGKPLLGQIIPDSEDWGQPKLGPPQPFYDKFPDASSSRASPPVSPTSSKPVHEESISSFAMTTSRGLFKIVLATTVLLVAFLVVSGHCRAQRHHD